MSYIFIDADAARRCVSLIREKTERLREAMAGEPGAVTPELTVFCVKVEALSSDLSTVTEDYAAEDERLKAVHLMNNEGGRLNNGQ